MTTHTFSSTISWEQRKKRRRRIALITLLLSIGMWLVWPRTHPDHKITQGSISWPPAATQAEPPPAGRKDADQEPLPSPEGKRPPLQPALTIAYGILYPASRATPAVSIFHSAQSQQIAICSAPETVATKAKNTSLQKPGTPPARLWELLAKEKLPLSKKAAAASLPEIRQAYQQLSHHPDLAQASFATACILPDHIFCINNHGYRACVIDGQGDAKVYTSLGAISIDKLLHAGEAMVILYSANLFPDAAPPATDILQKPEKTSSPARQAGENNTLATEPMPDLEAEARRITQLLHQTRTPDKVRAVLSQAKLAQDEEGAIIILQLSKASS